MNCASAIVFVTLLAALFIVVLAFVLLYGRYSSLRWIADHERAIREDAIQKSQATTLGKITEHFIPYLPEFNYNSKGRPILRKPHRLHNLRRNDRRGGQGRCLPRG